MIKSLHKHWFVFSIIGTLFVAIVLRFYMLGSVPHGMTWDEAAIGYNGQAILETRRDEWLQRLPVSFQSFGDYKAPLAIYINGIFTLIFGMNLFSVRLPFAILSVFGILGIMLLTLDIFEKEKLSKYYSLFAGFLMTLSPWHIHYSRAGFESGMALSFFIWGLLFAIKAIKTGFKNLWVSLLSVALFVAAIYTYHSSKVVIPLVLLALLITSFKIIKSNFKKVLLPIIAFILLLIPFIKDAVYGEGLTRAGVTIFSTPISLLEKISYILSSYVQHLTPSFLLFGETTTLRHGTGVYGVLFFTTFLLVITGFIALIAQKNKLEYHFFFLLLLLIGLLPACIALEVPHSNRSLMALPGFILTAVFGLDYLIKKLTKTNINKKAHGSHGETNIVVKSVVGSLIMIHIFLSVTFINHYFTTFAAESADAFKDGYLEAFEIARQYEEGEGVKSVSKIVFTSKYGQPYIYALFVRETNPIWYNGGSLNVYEFKEEVDIGDLSRENTLVVAAGGEESLPSERADHLVYGSDGEIKFQIFRTE